MTQAHSQQTQTALAVQPLDNLATFINRRHALVKQHANGMLAEAKKAGEYLLVAKEHCPHGTFRKWIEENTTVPYRTARRYMQVSKMVVNDHFDPDATIDSVLDTNKSRREKPKASQQTLPEFTKEDAEYAQKIAARMDSDFEGEREVAKAKLERFAESFGMTADEVIGKAEEVNPYADLTAHEAKNQAIKEDVLKTFKGMSKKALLDVIFDLIRELGKQNHA